MIVACIPYLALSLVLISYDKKGDREKEIVFPYSIPGIARQEERF